MFRSTRTCTTAGNATCLLVIGRQVWQVEPREGPSSICRRFLETLFPLPSAQFEPIWDQEYQQAIRSRQLQRVENKDGRQFVVFRFDPGSFFAGRLRVTSSLQSHRLQGQEADQILKFVLQKRKLGKFAVVGAVALGLGGAAWLRKSDQQPSPSLEEYVDEPQGVVEPQEPKRVDTPKSERQTVAEPQQSQKRRRQQKVVLDSVENVKEFLDNRLQDAENDVNHDTIYLAAMSLEKGEIIKAKLWTEKNQLILKTFEWRIVVYAPSAGAQCPRFSWVQLDVLWSDEDKATRHRSDILSELLGEIDELNRQFGVDHSCLLDQAKDEFVCGAEIDTHRLFPGLPIYSTGRALVQHSGATQFEKLGWMVNWLVPQSTVEPRLDCRQGNLTIELREEYNGFISELQERIDVFISKRNACAQQTAKTLFESQNELDLLTDDEDLKKIAQKLREDVSSELSGIKTWQEILEHLEQKHSSVEENSVESNAICLVELMFLNHYWKTHDSLIPINYVKFY